MIVEVSFRIPSPVWLVACANRVTTVAAYRTGAEAGKGKALGGERSGIAVVREMDSTANVGLFVYSARSRLSQNNTISTSRRHRRATP